ncbi:MAG: hypothetical protein ACP5C3_05590 [Methanomicrobiales archaeon]
MPIDKNIVDSILDTYRNMLKEVEGKAVGESYEKMKETLQRMESLALEMDDLAAYTAKLTTENLFVEFSNAYSNVVSSMVKDEYSKGGGDDFLLQKTLQSYENAINTLKENPGSEKLIEPIKELIDLGNSGVSYPVFLRISEEKGLNKALEGNMVVRDAILQDVEFAKFMHLPVEIEMHQEILEKFDYLSSKSVFGVPDSFEFNLKRQKIEWEYKPLINKWHMIIRVWEKMLENVYDWLDSYGNFAPHDDRWLDMRGESFTRENIIRTKECNPGIFQAREKLFYDYFKLKWEDIFEHESFLNEYNARRVWYSDETLELIKKAYSYCKPFQNPPEDLIKKAEEIYAGKRYKRPDAFQLSKKDKKRFIRMFGEEKYKEMLK